MKPSITEILRCPGCYGALDLRIDAERLGVAWDGTLDCRDCSRSFPVREGVAYLAVLNVDWATILKEMVFRRRITEEELKEGSRLAADHGERLAEQNEVVDEIARRCFVEAREGLGLADGARVLDCGAGMFETTAWFAERGAEAVATETDIAAARWTNFVDFFEQPPPTLTICGLPWTSRNPRAYPVYFSRLVSDIHRLPFADGAFDATFCRAMLHHVGRLPRAIRELARVTRPGGRLALAAEPIRSVFDRESDHVEYSVDREAGLNERAPTLWAYRRPLAPFVENFAVQYWPQAARFTTKRIFGALRYDYSKHLWPGETTRGWKWTKLLPVSAAINVYGTRNDRPAPKPMRLPEADRPPTIAEVARFFFDDDGRRSLEGLIEGTEALNRIRLGLLARRAEALPRVVRPGRCPGMSPALEAGWSPTQRGAGEIFRYVFKRASMALRLPETADDAETRLIVEYGAGRDGFSAECRLRVNGRQTIELRAEGGRWRREAFALDAEAIEAGRGRVALIEFECTRRNALGADGLVVGMAFRVVGAE